MFRLKLFRKSRRNVIMLFIFTFLYIYFLSHWNAIYTRPRSSAGIRNNSTGIYQYTGRSGFEPVPTIALPDNRPTPVNVILIASWRSGSTFTGQLFNMQQDIFYLFEPLRFLGQEKVQQERITKVLEAMYKCDFENSLLREWVKQTNHDILHRISSNALLKLCPKEITKGAIPGPCTRDTFKKCPELKPENVTQVCKSYSYKFFKVIKLTDITFLEEVVRNYKVKIIHLVRDPRGIHFSRQRTYDERYNMTNKLFGMYWTCQHVNKIVKLWDKETKWLLGNYKRIRFEDLSLQPIESAREIYDFLQIPFTEKIKKWIEENSSKNNNQTQSKKCSYYKNHKLNKKSSDVAHAWRMNSNLTTVIEIQETCAEAMQTLGYLNVYTQRQLRDNNFPVMKGREEMGV